MAIHSIASSYTTSSGLRNGNGNGHHKPVLITGHKPALIAGREIAAYSNDEAAVRGAIAAQLALKELLPVDLTVAQASLITGATIGSTYNAMRLAPETRARVAKGELSLADAMRGNGLVAAYLNATPDELVALGTIVGVSKVWDDVIAPSLD